MVKPLAAAWKHALGSLVWEERLPRPKGSVTLPVRGYRQLDSYSCGFVAGFTVVHLLKPSVLGMRFHQLCKPDPDGGTPEYRLIAALRKSGIAVYSRKKLSFEDIARYIEAGKPIIITVKLSEEISHWCTIYGVNRNSKMVYVSGSWTKSYTWRRFRAAWYGVGDGLVCSRKQ